MMAEKAKLFGDFRTRIDILRTLDPARQKILGRRVQDFNYDVWQKNAKDIVYEGNKFKFTQNPHLLKLLYDTRGTTLVEAASYDRLWGIGLNVNDPRHLDKNQWRGKNWLGEVLTKLRDDLYEVRFGLTQDDNLQP